jgi:hypothetical protein
MERVRIEGAATPPPPAKAGNLRGSKPPPPPPPATEKEKKEWMTAKVKELFLDITGKEKGANPNEVAARAIKQAKKMLEELMEDKKPAASEKVEGCAPDSFFGSPASPSPSPLATLKARNPEAAVGLCLSTLSTYARYLPRASEASAKRSEAAARQVYVSLLLASAKKN